MSHLEYVEREAAKNWAFHLQNLESLSKESNTTLTFLYVVIGASFTAAVKLFQSSKATGLALALCVLCLYLAALGMYLIFGCLSPRTVKAPANEPANLKLQKDYTSDEIRQFELDNLQERIDFNRRRNETTARRLNCVRVLVCLSPLVFGLVLACLFPLGRAMGYSWF